jgi:hypothetical protein
MGASVVYGGRVLVGVGTIVLVGGGGSSTRQDPTRCHVVPPSSTPQSVPSSLPSDAELRLDRVQGTTIVAERSGRPNRDFQAPRRNNPTPKTSEPSPQIATRSRPIYTTMARKTIAKDQIVKLIVGAGQASPSPPVGPALGSKGVKSMDFCKVRLPRAVHRPLSPHIHSYAGVQRSHIALQPRHTRTRPHNRPSRPLLPLLSPHSTHGNSPPQCRRRPAHEEQDPRRRQRPWSAK